MIKRKIFVSYDLENDERLKAPFEKVLTRPDSPFEIKAMSTPVTDPARTWELATNKAIHGCEVVIILLGPKTHQAVNVIKEAEIAFDEEIPVIQVIAYKNTKPKPVPNAGRTMPFNWAKLKNMV